VAGQVAGKRGRKLRLAKEGTGQPGKIGHEEGNKGPRAVECDPGKTEEGRLWQLDGRQPAAGARRRGNDEETRRGQESEG
jgi:hypothetical protein